MVLPDDEVPIVLPAAPLARTTPAPLGKAAPPASKPIVLLVTTLFVVPGSVKYTPNAPLPAMLLLAMTLPVEPASTPMPIKLGTAAVFAALRPIVFWTTTLPLEAAIWMPYPVLPEMTLEATTSPFEITERRPVPLGKAVVPVRSVPM